MLDQVGTQPYFNPALDEVGVRVFQGPCRLFDRNITVEGAGATVWFLMFDADKLADVTLGTTVPTLAWPVTDDKWLDDAATKPIQFSLGLCIFATAGPMSASAPAENPVVNLTYAVDGYGHS